MQFWSTASTRRPKGWGAAACDLNVADLDFSPAQCEADKSVPGKIRPTTPSPPRPQPPRIPRPRLVSPHLSHVPQPSIQRLRVSTLPMCSTLYPLPQSSQTRLFTLANSLVFAVTSVSLRLSACPAISMSYAPIGFPIRSSEARTPPASRASSSSKPRTRTGPARKVARSSAFSFGRALLATPYQSSYKTTVETQTRAPAWTALSNRARTDAGSPLFSAMQELVSSR